MYRFVLNLLNLGIQLDGTIKFCRHLESLRNKLTTRVKLLRQLGGSSWGANATILRTAILALIDSTAEYCAPVWCGSALTRLIDKPNNNVLRIVKGCLRPIQRTTFLSYQASNQLCFAAKNPYSL